ncbi:hypothetical protein L2227_01025 [Wolbachia endosymbiont of Delia radicum]|nr:hypothetical protein [Wolbachia endosymbiont of Delia radicum]UJQ21194.1 hypothetical protein L2227_01025 [Wolbachia endosymbiont of Delia radicum]
MSRCHPSASMMSSQCPDYLDPRKRNDVMQAPMMSFQCLTLGSHFTL